MLWGGRCETSETTWLEIVANPAPAWRAFVADREALHSCAGAWLDSSRLECRPRGSRSAAPQRTSERLDQARVEVLPVGHRLLVHGVLHLEVIRGLAGEVD